MSSQTLYRLSGVALIIGGVLVAVCLLLSPGGNDPSKYTLPLWFPVNLLILIGAMLVTLGLPGMYARQAQQTGKLGLLGFILTFCVVLIFNIASSTVETFIFPVLAGQAATRQLFAAGPPPAFGLFMLVGVLFELIGPVLLGIATIRAHVFPRWTGWLLLATSLVGLISFFLPLHIQIDAVLFALVLACFGFILLSQRARSEAALQPPLASGTAKAGV